MINVASFGNYLVNWCTIFIGKFSTAIVPSFLLLLLIILVIMVVLLLNVVLTIPHFLCEPRSLGNCFLIIIMSTYFLWRVEEYSDNARTWPGWKKPLRLLYFIDAWYCPMCWLYVHVDSLLRFHNFFVLQNCIPISWLEFTSLIFSCNLYAEKSL